MFINKLDGLMKSMLYSGKSREGERNNEHNEYQNKNKNDSNWYVIDRHRSYLK